MIIFNIISCSIIFRLLGGGFSKSTDFPRFISIGLIIVIIGLNVATIADAIAYFWLFFVVRLIPTQALLATCIDGKAPVRKDGIWQFLQAITFNIWLAIDKFLYDLIFPTRGKARIALVKIRSVLTSLQTWGIIYGVIRVSLALPAILWIGKPWLLVFLGLGILYAICGAFTRRFGYGQPVLLSEIIVGACFGGML